MSVGGGAYTIGPPLRSTGRGGTKPGRTALSACVGGNVMKWITREHPRVDRVACPWLVERFVDKQAEFIYVPTDKVEAEAKRVGATPFDTKGAELGHHGPECS